MTAAGPVFLDHAAATPLRPEVAEELARTATEAWANPSSPHAAGRRARRVLEECRERILALVGARATGSGRDRLVFTSGTTEANRLALLGMAAGQAGAAGCIASSARDHASVRATAKELGDRGWRVFEPMLEPTGAIDRGWTVPEDAPRPRILSLTLDCGQTGTREFRGIGPAADSGGRDVLLHADAAQAMLCHPPSFADSGFATLSLAPCKFGGPRGIGATIVRAGIPFAGLVPGPQEGGLRGGTEAVPLAAGFARALEIVITEQRVVAERLRLLRERLATRLIAAARAAGIPADIVAAYGDAAANLLVVTFPGIDRQAFVMAADLEGVACASGTACASGSSEPAPAVAALRIGSELERSAVRFSLGAGTTEAEIDVTLARLQAVFGRRRQSQGP
jgi:cysteine desulfurase